jgi:hypothetical protein
MPETDLRGYPYPDIDEAPAGPYAIEQLAEAVEADMEVVDAKHTRPFGHMGMTSGFFLPGNGGRPPMEAAQILRGGMSFDDANDALAVPKDGLYRVSAQIYSSGFGWGTQIGVVICKPAGGGADFQTGLNTRFFKEQGNDTPDTTGHITGTLDLNAGDKLYLSCFFTGLVSTWGASGFSGTYLELEFSQP